MRKLKSILVIVLFVAVIGAGATFLLGQDVLGISNTKGATANELAELSINTDVITTNLSSNNFAVVQFNILLESKNAKEELEKRTPEVRAAVISTLAGFTKEQVTGKEGLANLEKELFSKLKVIVETGRVERVLVTEFKVQ